MYKLSALLSVVLCLNMSVVAAPENATVANKDFIDKLQQLEIPNEYRLNDFFVGSEKAPVVLIIYSSFTCEFCRDFFLKMWPLFKKAFVDTGKVRVCLRSFADDLGALEAAQFMNCLTADINANDRLTLSLNLYKRQRAWKNSKKPPEYLRAFFVKHIAALMSKDNKSKEASSTEAIKAAIAKCEGNVNSNAGVFQQLKEAYLKFGIQSIPAFVAMSRETFQNESALDGNKLPEGIKLHQGKITNDKLKALCKGCEKNRSKNK